MNSSRGGAVSFWSIILVCLAGLIGICWTAVVQAKAGADATGADAAGQWVVAGAMPQELAALGLAASNNHLIVTGGQTGPSAPVADVRSAAIGGTGGLSGGWASSAMPGRRSMHGVQVYGNALYVLGGSNPDVLESVQMATVSGDGTPVNWREAASLPEGRGLAGSAAWDRYLYVAGGWGADSEVHDEVYFAAIAGDGSLGGWQTTTRLPAPRSNLSLTAAGAGGVGYLYAIGGSDSRSVQANVWRARVGSDGTLGPWVALGSLPGPRMDHAAVLYHDELLVLGGSDGPQVTTVYDTVLSARVGSDGGLGGWQTNASLPGLPMPLARHAAVVANVPGCGAALYVAGGRSSTAYQRTVYVTACGPTPTPTTPWVDWHPGAAAAIRPGGTGSVEFDFGNQSPPTVIHATLSGPVVFAGSGSSTFDTSLPWAGGTYALSIRAKTDAQPGQLFYVTLSANASSAPLFTGRIARGTFLPIGMQRFAGSGPTPATSTPTPTGPPPTSTPTRTNTPTPTPSPTAPSGIYGKVTYKGSVIANIAVNLIRATSSTSSIQASTTTAADGTYLFASVPSLPAGYIYYVRFGPNSTNSSYLFVWFGPDISSYTAGARVTGGDFDIANISLSSPSDGFAGVLPITFQWARRANASEGYCWAMESLTTDEAWISNELGYVGSFTLGSLPTGTSYGVQYGWYAVVYQSADSFGSSFFYRRFTILAGSPSESATGEPASVGPPLRGTTAAEMAEPALRMDPDKYRLEGLVRRSVEGVSK